MNYHSQHWRPYFNLSYYKKNDMIGASTIDIIFHRFRSRFKINVLSNSVSNNVSLPDLQKATYFSYVFINWREGANVSFPFKDTNPMVRVPPPWMLAKNKSISKAHLLMSSCGRLQLQQKKFERTHSVHKTWTVY